jgi:hypothetical protein
MQKFILTILMLTGTCMASTAVTAQNQTSSAPEGRGSGPNLEVMIQRNAYAAGMAAICRPEIYDRIRFCTMGIALSWRDLTGISIDVRSREVQTLMDRTWQASAIRGRDEQSRQGANSSSCREFSEQIEKEDFWRICEELRRAKIEEMQGSTPPERGSPSGPQTQAQPQAPRPGGSRGIQIQ